jgi:DNA-binding transcriptional ArsR family regulator
MDTLKQTVAELLERVARLESRHSPPGHPVMEEGDAPPGEGRVVYSGKGPWKGRSVVWQMERPWDEVTGQDPAAVAGVLSALGNPVRVRILTTLVQGPASTGDLGERVAEGTSGQLFHHLKELLACGVVHQPQRGTYALRPQHVLPLLAVLSAAMDLAATVDGASP